MSNPGVRQRAGAGGEQFLLVPGVQATHHALQGRRDEAAVHRDESATHVGLGAGGAGERPGAPHAPHEASPRAPTWISSSLELKWDKMTFWPSETRVSEMPRRPLARSWQSAGRVLSRQPRMVFTRLKEGCRGPRNRFRASLDTSMMLAPASPGGARPQDQGVRRPLGATRPSCPAQPQGSVLSDLGGVAGPREPGPTGQQKQGPALCQLFPNCLSP